MTDKKTYWLVDTTGKTALVEGAAERDRWVPLGWSETDVEPDGDSLVWASCEGVEEPALFPAGVLAEVWSAKGWTPSAPPEPVNPMTGERPARPEPVSTTTATADTTVNAVADTAPAKPAAGGEKEKNRA